MRHVPSRSGDISEFLLKLQRQVRKAGLDLEVGLTRQRRLVVRHSQYGSHLKFKGFSRHTPLLSKRPGKMEWSRKGKDIQGTLNGEPAFGVGRMLVGFQDNPHTSELAVVWRGARLEKGHPARVFVVQNGIHFQDFTDSGRPLRRICLPSLYTTAQGRWLETRSGYRTLEEAGAGTWQEIGDTLQLIFDLDLGDHGRGRRLYNPRRPSQCRVGRERLPAGANCRADSDGAPDSSPISEWRRLRNDATAT